jgi:hypothetical protein
MLALPACDGTSTNYTTHIVPTVALLSPDGMTDVEQGNVVTIRYIDSCPSGPGHTDLLADCDGDLVTDEDQYVIEWGRPAVDGIEQSVLWDTMTMPEGSYHIIARTDDGVVRVTDAADGVVTIKRNPPPTATVRFPPDRCLTDAETITVTGNSSDASGVQSVTVNGLAVTTDNNYATWSVVVPLEPGENLLMVRTMDVLGFEDVGAAMVMIDRATALDPIGTGLPLTEPVDLAFDVARDRVYLTDAAENRVYSISVETGARTVYSDETNYGPALDMPMGAAYDATSRELYIGDGQAPGEILVVYPDGLRELVSGFLKGSGDSLPVVTGLALDLDNDRMFATTEDSLFEVNRTTGDRTVVYAGSEVYAVDYDPASDLLLFAEGDRILQWNGAATELSGPAVGAGPEFNAAISVRLDMAHGRAFASDARDYEDAAIFSVRLDNGDRSIISGYGRGDGPAFGLPLRVAHDAGRNVLYVSDYWTSGLYVVEIESGDRVVLSR